MHVGLMGGPVCVCHLPSADCSFGFEMPPDIVAWSIHVIAAGMARGGRSSGGDVPIPPGRPSLRGKREAPKPPAVPGGDEAQFGGFGDDTAGGQQTYENLAPPALDQPVAPMHRSVPKPGGKVSILTADIIREKQIGEGEFGEVCQGVWLHDGQREVRIVPYTRVVSHAAAMLSGPAGVGGAVLAGAWCSAGLSRPSSLTQSCRCEWQWQSRFCKLDV